MVKFVGSTQLPSCELAVETVQVDYGCPVPVPLTEDPAVNVFLTDSPGLVNVPGVQIRYNHESKKVEVLIWTCEGATEKATPDYIIDMDTGEIEKTPASCRVRV